VGAPEQPLCGRPQYLKEILFKVKEILLSVNFSLFPDTVVKYFYDFFILKTFNQPQPGGSRLMLLRPQFVEVSGQVLTLPSPKSGPG